MFGDLYISISIARTRKMADSRHQLLFFFSSHGDCTGRLVGNGKEVFE